MSNVPDKCHRCGHKVPLITLVGCLSLAAVKCISAVLCGSVALMVDGFHSLSDGVAAIFVLGSLRIATKPKDGSHPYGHGKLEFLASLIVFSVLVVLGGLLFYGSTRVLMGDRSRPPHMLGCLVAAICIIANYVMFSFNRCAGRKLGSPALTASGQDNLADLLSSVPVAAGVIASQFGYLFADAVAAMLVSLFIMASALRQSWYNLSNLMDRAAPPATRRHIRNMALSVEGVRGMGCLRTRRVGRNLWIDMDIIVSPDCSVETAAAIAAEVRGTLLRKAKKVEDVVVYFRADDSAKSIAAVA